MTLQMINAALRFKKLKDFGVRVQNSVFECILEQDKIDEMKQVVAHLLDEEDSVKIYYLCEACKKKINSYRKAGWLLKTLPFILYK